MGTESERLVKVISGLDNHWLFFLNFSYISKIRGVLLSEGEEEEVSLEA